MSRLKIEYDPILGCVGWEFKSQPKKKLNKNIQNQSHETSRKIHSNKND